MSDLSPRLLRVQVAALGVIVVAIAGATFGALASTDSDWVVVHADKKLDEHVSLDEELGVFLVQKSTGTIAISDRGPWNEERIFYCETSELFETTRSGSKFDKYGRYLYGPAPRGLTRYETRVVDGDILIYTGELIPGPSRKASSDKALKPVGPYCLVT